MNDRFPPAQRQGDTTPPNGSELDGMGPAEAVIYLAEQLKELREKVIHLAFQIGGAAIHADRGANIAENVREELRQLVAAVDDISVAVLQLQPLHGSVASANGHIVQLLGDTQAIYVRLASVERASASAAFTAGKAWQGISDLRVESANTGKAVFELMQKYSGSQDEIRDLKARVSMAERRAEAASEQAEEADEWIENTGKRHAEDMHRRASWGEEMLEAQIRVEVAKKQAEARKLADEAARQQAEDEQRRKQAAADAEELRAEKQAKRERRNKAVAVVATVVTAGAGTIWLMVQQNCGG
jgi:predicted  nucleic acid-binding Zn-ribbon protein